MILLSPLGVKIPPEGWKPENIRFKGGRGPPKWAVAISKLAWGSVTPFAIGRKLPDSRVRKFLGSYVRRH